MSIHGTGARCFLEEILFIKMDRINAGELDIPPIKVDGNIIVDGNHRYIVGQITGTNIPTMSWRGDANNVIPWSEVKLDDVDWGNR